MRTCREMFQRAGFHVDHSECFRVSWLWGMMMFVCEKRASTAVSS
jgi:hypothetical protein